jgi:hypothetical protein
MPILAALTLLPAMGLVGAAVLWRLGLRGRKIDDHPLCGRCGYDLFGAEHSVCPECGADVSGRGAVRVGHRQRRRGLLWAALVLAVAGGVGATVVGRSAYRALGAVENQPTWWLARGLDTRPAYGAIPAFGELSGRLGRGELSAGQTRRIVGRLLKWQADRSVRWNAAWGNFVETARGRGLIADEQWAQYARQGVVFEIKTRRTVRRGEDIPYSIGVTNCRFGDGHCVELRYSTIFRLAGLPVGSSGLGSSDRLSPREGSSRGGRITLPSPVLDRTADGAHVLEAAADLEVFERPKDPTTPPLVTWHEVRPLPLDLVPADAEAVEVVRTPEFQKHVERALSVRRLDYDPGRGRVMIELAYGTLRINVAADVWLRTAEGEWPISTVSFHAQFAGTTQLSGKAEVANLARADVVVRSSTAVARKTLDMTRIWGGEVVLRDVPVTRRGASTTPTRRSSTRPPTTTATTQNAR